LSGFFFVTPTLAPPPAVDRRPRNLCCAACLAPSPRNAPLFAAPKPLNVLVMKPGTTVAELAELGVRRVSVGGALARVAWSALAAAAEQIKAGSFEGLAGGTPGKPLKLNDVFRSFG
jgi:hypothetical protein